MSFYVKSTPEVANFYGFTEFNPDNIFLVCNDKVVGVTNECSLKHLYPVLPEYKFHPKHGFVPSYYSELFLDNTPEDWSQSESLDTKQQNEKSDQKEENENMNRKENGNIIDAAQKLVMDLVEGKKSNQEMIYDWDKNRGSDKFENYVYKNNSHQKEDSFPVVGQTVVIDPNLITSCPVLKDCLGKEVTVIAKYKYYNIDMVSVCFDEFSDVACVRADRCLPVKTEKEKEIENILYLICEGGTVNDIADRLYNEGYRKQKD